MARKRVGPAGDIDAGGRSAALFFALVVLGAAYIIVAKLDSLPAAYVTFVPVALMLSYAGTIYFLRSFRLRDDQSGDNLYYMGFLFTLISLGMSLYQFSADGAAETIVQNFGIAVASTIAGVALRVAFTQMRRDPVDIERTARLELAEAARRMRRELDGSVVELNHFRRATLQSMLEGYADVQKHISEVSSSLVASIEDLARKSAEPLARASSESGVAVEEMTRRVVDAVEATAAKLDAETGKLSDGSAAVSSSLSHVATRLAEMQTPDKVIEISLAPVTREFAESTGDLVRVVTENDEASRRIVENAQAERQQAERVLLEAIGRIESTSTQSMRLFNEAFEGLQARDRDTGRLSEFVLQIVQRLDDERTRSVARDQEMTAAVAERDVHLQQTVANLIEAIGQIVRSSGYGNPPLPPHPPSNDEPAALSQPYAA